MTAVYERNEYPAEKREALAAWGRHLDELLQPTDAPRLKLESAA